LRKNVLYKSCKILSNALNDNIDIVLTEFLRVYPFDPERRYEEILKSKAQSQL